MKNIRIADILLNLITAYFIIKRNRKKVLIIFTMCIFIGIALYSCIVYPQESGLWRFSEEGRTQHARYIDSVNGDRWSSYRKYHAEQEAKRIAEQEKEDNSPYFLVIKQREKERQKAKDMRDIFSP